MVCAAAWASWVSVRSAVRGPGWALGHFRSTARFTVPAAILSAVVVVVLRPVWVGLSIGYTVAAVALLAWAAGRRLERLAALGGFDPLDSARRGAIVLAARRALILGGAVLIGVAGLLLQAGGGPSTWILAAVGGVVSVNGLAIGSGQRDQATVRDG